MNLINEIEEMNKNLNNKIEEINLKLIKNRIRGRTINAIFVDTILYLLEIKGPLSTTEIHPLIQQINSDICDDNVDRVIDGKHFGKKGKHYVRAAQEFLQDKRIILLNDGKWYLNQK